MDGCFSLVEHFSTLNDPRIERSKKHKLFDILVIAVIGVLCGGEGWQDMEMIAQEKQDWLSQFLELANGIPSHDTISRVFARICPKMFEKCFVAWMKDVATLSEGELIAIDGKRVRRSFDHANQTPAIHMVSAWAKDNGLVIAQTKVQVATSFPSLLVSLIPR